MFFSFLLSASLNLWRLAERSSRLWMAWLKNLYLRLSPKQRAVALAVALIIIVIPFVLLNRDTKNTPAAPPESVPAQESATLPPLHNDKNVHSLEAATLLITEPELLAPVLVRGTLLAVTPNPIIDLTDAELPKKHTLPDGAGAVLKVVPLRDLGLPFF